MIARNNITIDNYMLYNNIPVIDLHGENKEVAILKTKEFISDNLKLRNYIIQIVHGIGEGILKEEIHKFLKTDKRVAAYKLDLFNQGITVVELTDA